MPLKVALAVEVSPDVVTVALTVAVRLVWAVQVKVAVQVVWSLDQFHVTVAAMQVTVQTFLAL